jgi:MinD-like ATPase involved in chromosome partitioning or flagellar assembly
MSADETDRTSEGDDRPTTAALVGAAGGAGATRLTVEVAAVLGAEGHRVAAFDAAFATQGMSDYVEGRIDPDVTDLVTEEGVTPAAAMVELDGVGPGAVHLCPARATFGGLARASAPEAARRFEAAVAEARDAFEVVLVDVPPVASNPAVSAVTAADRVGVVAPPGERGADAVQRTRDRLAGVGAPADLVVANRGDPDPLSPDVVVPEGPTGVRAAPAAPDGEGEFAAGVADLAGALVGREPSPSTDPGGILDGLR